MKTEKELDEAIDYLKRVEAAWKGRKALHPHRDVKPDQILFGGHSTEENYRSLRRLLGPSLVFFIFEGIYTWVSNDRDEKEATKREPILPRPPINAEYILYLVLRKDERDVVIGDLIESYGHILRRFNKRRADLWFYKQVIASLIPLLYRQVLKIGALVWLGRILRRLIS